ncbi:PLP-dependent aminotransferase family protein [Gracilibacillus sp. YIM 98692]|uniref:aminotransferase-like domain-containing protein n=1 Tax=Gracilibacillus sp. YIM 98692 TaxID=2663532 RepID=UPI0013D6ABA8|nr:PLP-dependent aminotransferase family protein [Gracilibacillus sp. YIM 98692]
MKMESYFSKNITDALKNDPPGEWMPAMPDDCIRLSSGFPAPNLVPVEGIKNAVVDLLDDEQDLPLHYLGTPKMDQLKSMLQDRMAERGMPVSDKELLVTAGACQAIDFIARVFIDEQTIIAIESPTYMEALEVFQNYTSQFLNVPVDEYGMQTDVLEKMLEDRQQEGLSLPKLLYTIPTFQNPTGTTMTEARRKHVIELAETYDFLILEDDAYGELYFDEQAVPLKALDRAERVLYVGSLSKVVAPGLRIGWVATTRETIQALYWFKKDLDHPFTQAIMATFLEKNDLGKRLEMLRNTYQARRNVLLSALKEQMPDGVSWYVPEGGYFIWIKVSGVDTSLMLDQALDAGVSYVPGKYFFLENQESIEWLRLSFSYASEEDMIEGVRKLSKVVKESL